MASISCSCSVTFFLSMISIAHGWSGSCNGSTATQVVAGVDLTGQTHVLTGGDSGLGFETAMALSSANATIFILSYDAKGKGAAAAANISKITGNRVEVVQCDLSIFASVEAAVAEINSKVTSINVLICDAGISSSGSMSSVTSDGFERVVETNFLGHFLLVESLLPKLRLAEGRVINVASAASFEACPFANAENNCTDVAMIHRMATTPTPAGVSPVGLNATNYGYTKYWQVFHAAEVAHREHSQGPPFGAVLAFSLHPGFVETPMTKNMPASVVKAWCQGESRPCPISASVGASTQTYLASASYSSILANNGNYFDQCVAVPSIRDDMVKAKGQLPTLAYQSEGYNAFHTMVAEK
eukprot:m.260873 g.260873  ORF g.260873 m.260873 type:complete len:357 (-) comp40805_c0_seq1:231-1301(-)